MAVKQDDQNLIDLKNRLAEMETKYQTECQKLQKVISEKDDLLNKLEQDLIKARIPCAAKEIGKKFAKDYFKVDLDIKKGLRPLVIAWENTSQQDKLEYTELCLKQEGIKIPKEIEKAKDKANECDCMQLDSMLPPEIMDKYAYPGSI